MKVIQWPYTMKNKHSSYLTKYCSYCFFINHKVTTDKKLHPLIFTFANMIPYTNLIHVYEPIE